jgi:hypothetical protein
MCVLSSGTMTDASYNQYTLWVERHDELREHLVTMGVGCAAPSSRNSFPTNMRR